MSTILRISARGRSSSATWNRANVPKATGWWRAAWLVLRHHVVHVFFLSRRGARRRPFRHPHLEGPAMFKRT